MYLLNKCIGYLTNPVVVGWIVVLLALGARFLERRRLAIWLLVWSVAWMWLWAMPLISRGIGVALERPYLVDGRVSAVGNFPTADGIVLHGGGMGWCEALGGEALNEKTEQGQVQVYAEMWTSADRVWMAARLWKAGKAPLIYVIGSGCEASTKGLLMDLGVPTNAMVIADAPRNTEEEVKFIARIKGLSRILVVTSAWHMPRTELLYKKYAPKVTAIAAPCDFEFSLKASSRFSLTELLPSAEALLMNQIALHEWIGIFGYNYCRP